ncbi:MAG: lysylphosphatidylglycerol synthase transmembrane domain-containing protein [Dehalococcoidia bacterium]|nr:lysylphosphatidylglycerol synthase transmembrane domain-containing protein [Dehalococcoidia bacterium]
MLRSRRVWLGFAISLIFIGLFLYQTDFGEIRDAFAEAHYAIAFASLPVYFLGIWVRTIRWQYLLRPVARLSAARLYPVVIIGLMANNLIPARAGELVRAYILGEREKVSKAAALGTIAVDRLFDGLTLIPMLVIIGAFVSSSEEFPLPVVDVSINLFGLAVIMAVLFGAALSVLIVLAFSQRWRDRTDRLVHRLTPERFRPSVEGLAHSFFLGLNSLRSPTDLGVAWVMSTVSWLLEATMYYMVGRAFDIDVGFQYFLLITAAANLAISILASQGGIGPFELVAKQTLIAAGVGSSAATAYAIGLHALVLLPVIAVGLYFLGTMGISLGEMFRRSTAARAVEPEPMPAVLPQEEAPGT